MAHQVKQTREHIDYTYREHVKEEKAAKKAKSTKTFRLPYKDDDND